MQRDAACSREQGEAFKPEFGVTSLQKRLCLALGYTVYALLNPRYTKPNDIYSAILY